MMVFHELYFNTDKTVKKSSYSFLVLYYLDESNQSKIFIKHQQRLYIEG